MATPRARGANQRNAQLGCARARSASRQSQPTRTRASARPVATTRRDDDEAGGSLRRQNRHVSSSSSSRHNDGDDDDGNARVRRRVSSSSTRARSIIDAFVAGDSIRLSNQSRRRNGPPTRSPVRPSVRRSVVRPIDRARVAYRRRRRRRRFIAFIASHSFIATATVRLPFFTMKKSKSIFIRHTHARRRLID